MMSKTLGRHSLAPILAGCMALLGLPAQAADVGAEAASAAAPRLAPRPPVDVDLDGWTGYAPNNKPSPAQPEPGTGGVGIAELTLTSGAFVDGGAIPPQYTCEGNNESPPLQWSGVPSTTKSLVLLVTDANAESGKVAYWVAYSIPINITSLATNVPKVSTTGGFLQAKNDFSGIGYTGPCPPGGDGRHTFVFTLMALDSNITASPSASDYTSIVDQTTGHVIASGEISGTFERQTGAGGGDFQLTSTAFTDGSFMPSRYTCDGSDVSPPLTWSGAPSDTQSFVMTMIDADSPTGIDNCQWAAYNIPKGENSLEENIARGEFTEGFFQALNDLGVRGYSGPCPPRDGTSHRYRFTLTALSTQIDELDENSEDCDALFGWLSSTDDVGDRIALTNAQLTGNYARSQSGSTFNLTSSAFSDGNSIPSQYSCDGDNISFPLQWQGAPAATQSLALVMADADATDPAERAHWLTFDFLPTLSAFPENLPHLPFVNNVYQGTNDFGEIGYKGPCPPVEDDEHRYVMTLFALDEVLGLPTTATYSDFLAQAQGHVLETSELMGTFNRSPSGNVFSLGSSAFSSGRSIPQAYTCDGLNQSPPLEWVSPPEGTAAFALLMTDFNAPTGSHAHWALYNIPSTVTSLDEAIAVGTSPNPPGGDSAQALNHFSVQGYTGPCPPSGDSLHRYTFKLVALNQSIVPDGADEPGHVPEEPTYDDIARAIQGVTLGTVELNGTYERPTGGVGAFRLTSSAFPDNGVLPVAYRSTYMTDEDGDGEADRFDSNEDGSIDEDDAFDEEVCKASDWEEGVASASDVLNVSPPLQWENAPEGTVSFALLVTDENELSPDEITFLDATPNRAHWVAWDIPASVNSLNSDVPKIPFTGNFYHALNDVPTQLTAVDQEEGRKGRYHGYWGPCKPGHRYVFTLVALDALLSDVNKDQDSQIITTLYRDIVDGMKGHILGTAELLRAEIPPK